MLLPHLDFEGRPGFGAAFVVPLRALSAGAQRRRTTVGHTLAMHTLEVVLVGLAIAVGLLGIMVPVLPGALLVLAAILVWSLIEQTTAGWIVLGVAAVAILVTQVLKYVLPERHLRGQGVPWTTSLVGALVGIVGFFVLPVVGFPVGYVVGIFGVEFARKRAARPAWSATKAALKAAGMSAAVELAGALVAAYAWVGVLVVG